MIVLTTKNSFFLKGLLPEGCTHRAPLIRVISRLNYKPEGLRFELASEKIIKIQEEAGGKSFEQCCFERARQIENLPYKKIFLSYSGGIDSTLALVTFLKYWSKESLARLTVLMNLNSIEENPNFFRQFAERINFESIYQNYSARLETDEACLVTGEHGDQLFGSDLVGLAVRKFGDECIHQPFEDNVLPVFDHFISDQKTTKMFYERIFPIIHEAPFPIKTVHDFLWWYNFSLKWQYVKYRFLADKSWHQPQKTSSHVYHFFDTPSFQKWSLENHDKKIKSTWGSYKFVMKEIIHEFNRDESYLNKNKVASLPLVQGFMEYNNAFDKNFRPLSQEEVKSYVL